MNRKEREIVERESRILAVARQILVREGYHGLSMDRIADAIEYSKGTIYNHFPCKEEIIVALGIETMERRIGLFQRAAGFQGRSRERMQAVGVAAELFARLYPDHFFVEHMIRMSSIWEKASEARLEAFQAAEMRCMATVVEIVRSGVRQNELQLPEHFAPEDVVFGLWSLTSAAYSMAASNPNLANLGIAEPFHSVRELTRRLVDGFHWRPLTAEHDYDAVIERISQEIFQAELQRLALMSGIGFQPQAAGSSTAIGNHSFDNVSSTERDGEGVRSST
jgi:AcrR family transcriptional regulator